jgi:hypothetical protein
MAKSESAEKAKFTFDASSDALRMKLMLMPVGMLHHCDRLGADGSDDELEA